MIASGRTWGRMGLCGLIGVTALLCITAVAPADDASGGRPEHPGIRPADGTVSATNPPSMSWLGSADVASYTLELARDAAFTDGILRIEDLDMPLYNHSATLEPGDWYWRVYEVDGQGRSGEVSPVRRFRINDTSVPFPLPPRDQVLAAMPGHPRIFTTPDTLEAFRARRHGAGKAAWEGIRAQAEQVIDLKPDEVELLPVPDDLPSDGPRVLILRDGKAYLPADFALPELRNAASRAGKLSLAYLISGDDQYAEAAKRWALHTAQFRIDYHKGTAAERAARGSAYFSYTYEAGLKDIAQTYDRLYHRLSDAERQALLDHVEFHGEGNYLFLRDHRRIHLDHQQTQSMHDLFTTSLAVAGDLPAANNWMDYFVRQYANRIAWLSDDGGYFEGQLYSWKFRMIFEALAAMATATDVDIFHAPAFRNAGDFWLYCMSLNYWFPHGGDVNGLLHFEGNSGDAVVSGFLASMTGNPYVQWWSQTVKTNPFSIPLSYLTAQGLQPRPPVDIPQARAFHGVGQVSAFDRFYDHGSTRLFFRSSPWGGMNHAHADQNSFVIHKNGEILAADTGYYTYYNDDHYRHFKAATVSHNTVLVDGEGQGNDINSPGQITRFFRSPRYVLTTGDASHAYDDKVNTFDRTMVYIRPDLFIVLDELEAAEPGSFSWLLNTFSESRVDEAQRLITAEQRDTRMSIRHLLPRDVTYTQSNERKYGLLTRQWSRYTDAFPEPWNLRVTTQADQRAQTFLALMKAYDAADGDGIRDVARVTSDTTVGVRFNTPTLIETVLFSRGGQPGPLRGNDGSVSGEAAVAAVAQSPDGRVLHWMAAQGTSLSIGSQAHLRAAEPIDVAVSLNSRAAAAQVTVDAARPRTIELRLPTRPEQVFAAPPSQTEQAVAQPFSWRDGMMQVDVPEGETVLWIDPAWPLTEPLPTIDLTIEDSEGKQVVPLQMAVTNDGDWIAFAELAPQQVGTYEVEAVEASPTVEILVQDHWDPHVLSRRGIGTVHATLREATEVFFRFAPAPGDIGGAGGAGGADAGERVAANLPTLRARLIDPLDGEIDNLLHNGDFEVGLPGYPPRGWTVRPGVTGGNYGEARQGWPGWSQEQAAQGDASLKFIRPLNTVTRWRPPYAVMARDTMELNSVPMRLRTPGRYVLRFLARGSATHATVQIRPAEGRNRTITIEPSDDWRQYQAEVDLEAGMCGITVHFREGGEDDQVLWLDAMEFGMIEQP